jgi:hypothetical protein
MKKFCLIIILYFNILPCWKDGDLLVFQTISVNAQSANGLAIYTYYNYLKSTAPSGTTYNIEGNGTIMWYNATGYGTMPIAQGMASAGFQQWIQSNNNAPSNVNNELNDDSDD